MFAWQTLRRARGLHFRWAERSQSRCRFVGETNRTNGTNCTQMPIPLDYRVLVYAPAGSTVVYAVQQPDGTLLVRLLSSRSAAVGAARNPVR
jgi:hypothetical protein